MFKTIHGFEDYEINESGSVKRINGGKILSQSISDTGYYKVQLTKNNMNYVRKVHRLVAIAFIENPLNKKTVNHIDGNKLNNNIENLEWATHSENNSHAYRSGLRKTVESKYDKNTIEEVIAMSKSGHRKKDIAEKLGISCRLLNKLTLGSFSGRYKHSLNDRIAIKNLIINSNKTNRELSIDLGISAELIGRIKKGKSWIDLTMPSLNRLNSGEA